MKELRVWLVAAAACASGMLGAVVLLVGDHDSTSVAHIAVSNPAIHLRVRDCRPLERDAQYVPSCKPDSVELAVANRSIEYPRAPEAFVLIHDCNSIERVFHRCMQRYIRLASNTPDHAVHMTGFDPVQPGTFLTELKKAIR